MGLEKMQSKAEKKKGGENILLAICLVYFMS